MVLTRRRLHHETLFPVGLYSCTLWISIPTAMWVEIFYSLWGFAAVKSQTLNHSAVRVTAPFFSVHTGTAYALADYSAVHRLFQHWCVHWWCWWSIVKGVEAHLLFLGEYIRVFTLLCTISLNISPFTIPDVHEVLTKGNARCTQVWVSKACSVLEPSLPH